MKPAQLIGSLVLVLTGAALGHAQGSPYTATVKDAEAEVRSGPSTDPKMYVTNRLRKGDLVEVVKTHDPNWLAIKPPVGSFSWISTRFVNQVKDNSPSYYVVTHDDYPAPVRIGSSVVDQKPTVEGARLSRGSQVVAIGAPLASQDEGMWLPIEPPPSEVRYIRADVVQVTKVSEPPMAAPASVSGGGAASPAPAPFAPAAPPTTTVSLGGSGGGGSAPTTTTSNSPAPVNGSAVPPPPADPNSPEGMWHQAQQMENTGRKQEAESLYTRLAHAVSQVNHDLAMKCYNRIHFLKTSTRSGGGVSVPATTTSNQRSFVTPVDNRVSPIPASLNTPAVQGHVTACPGPTQTANFGGTTSPAPTLAPQAIGPGLLRVSGRAVDGQRAYALEDNRGQLLTYVTAQPGVNLDVYVNRIVSLYGPMVYHQDCRNNHMSAMSVQLAP